MLPEQERKGHIQQLLGSLNWKPRKPVEEMIDFKDLQKRLKSGAFRTKSKNFVELTSKELDLLNDITTLEYILDNDKKRWNRLGIKAGSAKKKLKNNLIKYGLAKEYKFFCGWNYSSLLYATETGWQYINKTNSLPGMGSELHKIFVYTICDWAEKNDYNYAVEKEVGRIKKRVDVLLTDKLGLENTAIEVALSSPDQELKNAIDDFSSGIIHNLIIACGDQTMRNKVESKIKSSKELIMSRDRIEICLIGKFFNSKEKIC